MNILVAVKVVKLVQSASDSNFMERRPFIDSDMLINCYIIRNTAAMIVGESDFLIRADLTALKGYEAGGGRTPWIIKHTSEPLCWFF